jgi:hypothetical protein
MADLRTFYRKSNLTDIWHFCRECENWPLRYYEEIADSPVIGFCLSCIQPGFRSRDFMGKNLWLELE